MTQDGVIMAHKETRMEHSAVSAIIGVCGVNFCSLVADRRIIYFANGDADSMGEDTDKIFKINDRVLFGATGLFNEKEQIIAPIKRFKDKKIITPILARDAVQTYLQKNMQKLPRMRSYLIGGKEADGTFCLIEMRADFENACVETVVRKPDGVNTNFGMSCLLPFSYEDGGKDVLEDVSRRVRESKTHDDLIHGLRDVIADISKVDPTVNSSTTVLNLF